MVSSTWLGLECMEQVEKGSHDYSQIFDSKEDWHKEKKKVDWRMERYNKTGFEHTESEAVVLSQNYKTFFFYITRNLSLDKSLLHLDIFNKRTFERSSGFLFLQVIEYIYFANGGK